MVTLYSMIKIPGNFETLKESLKTVYNSPYSLKCLSIYLPQQDFLSSYISQIKTSEDY